MLRPFTLFLLLFLAGILVSAAQAQAPASLDNRFFSVTISKNDSPLLAPVTFRDTEDHFIVQGSPLIEVISRAYGLENFQIVDGPEWINTPYLYDIDAVPPPAFVEVSEAEMLQALLADRFHLDAHVATREMEAFVLELAGENTSMELVSEEEANRGNFPRRLKSPAMMAIVWNFSMDSLAGFFSRQLGRPVLNLTGLRGTYATPVLRLDSTEPDIVVKVLLEHSGLKLEMRPTDVEVLVISTIEQPVLDE